MRYLLFAGMDYYPEGGASDFMSAHATVEEAMAAPIPYGAVERSDWAQVFDTKTLKIVKHYTNRKGPGWHDGPWE